MSQSETCFGEVWKMGQNWLCVDTAAEDLQRRTGMMKRMQQQEVLEEVRSIEESTWRLEPDGETEVPEIIIVSDAVKGTKVDLDGTGLQVKRMKETKEGGGSQKEQKELK